MYTYRTLPADSPCTWQLYASHLQCWTDLTAPEKKGSRHNPQPGWVIRRSTTQFLSQHSHWSSNESQTSIDSRLLGLPGTYHRHAISTFKYLLVGTNPSVLNQHRRGLQPCRCRLANTTPWPSQPMGLHFPPNGLTRSQVIHPTITNWNKERTNPKSREWDFSHSISSKHSMI
jgi:hypothetical protein